MEELDSVDSIPDVVLRRNVGQTLFYYDNLLKMHVQLEKFQTNHINTDIHR